MTLPHAVGQQLGSHSFPNVTSIVFVIEEDDTARSSLESLIQCEGWRAETFASAAGSLGRPRPIVPNCLILALSDPRMNGLQVQKQITRERSEIADYYHFQRCTHSNDGASDEGRSRRFFRETVSS